MSSEETSATASINLVRRLCEHWPSLTLEDYRQMLTPDCVYINMPMPSTRCVGPDQSYGLLSAFSSRWDITFDLIHIRGDENVVLTERLERFVSKADTSVVGTLQVMGVFELRDGKIAHWRDYFDSRESAFLTS